MLAVTPRRRAVPTDEPTPVLRLLDAAEEAGELDVRQVAAALGLDAGALRAALARPAHLARAQREALARALGVDHAALRRLLGPIGPVIDDPPTSGDDAPPNGPVAPVEQMADAPRSAGEAVARVVLAIDASAPWGRAARLAVLDIAERGAQAAARGVPRELHALRARVRAEPAAAAAPPAEESAAPVRARGGLPPEDVAVLDAAAAVIRTLQRTGAGYDDLFAPLHDDAVGALLRRFTLAEHTAPLGATSVAIVTPPIYGRAAVVLSDGASADQRRVARRLALAHAAAGHVREERPLPAPAPPHERRVAAVVALADLLPFWQLGHGRGRARMGWAAITDDVARQIASLAGDWPAAHVRDVATLRVALYRRDGL